MIAKLTFLFLAMPISYLAGLRIVPGSNMELREDGSHELREDNFREFRDTSY